MRVIFCDNGFSSKEVDYLFAEEQQAAKAAGLVTNLVSYEALKKADTATALRFVRPNENLELAIYRGWMLKPSEYEILYDGLLEKNLQLINDPTEYKFCHYLPENYETIKECTPKTTFKPLAGRFEINDFEEQLAVFGSAPIIVKDYVKSQKHYWEEACFIPGASDREKVGAVIRRFVDLQDSDLNEGLVFREFVELEALATHSQSGMPLTKEFRVFVRDGKVISVFKYWDEGDYGETEPVLKRFEALLPKVKSHFFSMDIAKQKNSDWIIVELGDGQVSGLPDNADKFDFYSKLVS
jgi:hypothetical protein